MDWTVGQVAQAAGGVVVAGAGVVDGQTEATAIDRVVIDSRLISGGELFVAIEAARDGHAFVSAAVEAGAAAVMVDRAKVPPGLAVPAVAVDGTAGGLLSLGSAARARSDAQVVGITGSVGKTSTKDLVAAAVGASRRVAASERSFNNELGVPLTLANAPGDAEVVIVEMGARGPGHIATLCQVARPTIGVVTAVSAAHIEMFGDLEGVARAKGELVEALSPAGTAVLNGDDPRVSAMASRSSAAVLRYSATGHPSAEVVAGEVVLDEELRPRFEARTPWGKVEVRLEARGAHQVGNALAALAVAGLCEVDPEVAARGMAAARLSPWRMELLRAPGGALVLNDAYNANPASTRAALEALAALPATRRVAVLGEMAELGASSRQEHQRIAELAGELGIELVAVGTDAYGLPPAAGLEEAEEAIGPLGPADAVLVKGSRVVGLERLAARLAAGS